MGNVGDIIGVIWIIALAIILVMSSFELAKDLQIHIKNLFLGSSPQNKKLIIILGVFSVSLFIVTFIFIIIRI